MLALLGAHLKFFHLYSEKIEATMRFQVASNTVQWHLPPPWAQIMDRLTKMSSLLGCDTQSVKPENEGNNNG